MIYEDKFSKPLINEVEDTPEPPGTEEKEEEEEEIE